MPWSLIASATAGSFDSQTSTTSAVNTVGADLFVVSVSWVSGGGNSYTIGDGYNGYLSGSMILSTTNSANPAMTSDVWFLSNPVTNSAQAFGIGSSNYIYPSVTVLAFRGSGNAPLDQYAAVGTIANGTSFQSRVITPATAGALVYCSATSDASQGSIPTINGAFAQVNWTNYLSSFNLGSVDAYAVQGGIASASPTWTFGTATNAVVNIASFQPARLVGCGPSAVAFGIGCGIWAGRKIEENGVITRRSLLLPRRRRLIGHN